MNLLEFVETYRPSTRGAPFLQATLIESRGFSNRPPGQKMFFDDQNNPYGRLLQGVLLPDLIDTVSTARERDQSILLEMDVEKDRCWKRGLGFGGSVKVIVEPLELNEILTRWKRGLMASEAQVLATRLPTQDEIQSGDSDQKLLITKQGDFTGTLGAEQLNSTVRQYSMDLFDKVQSGSHARTFEFGSGKACDVFLDLFVELPELIVFGAGHDSKPVVRIASELGFQIKVVDQREAFTTDERFPGAETVVSTPEQFPRYLSPDSRAAIVIMSHNRVYDREALRFAVDSPASYVGLLGPPWRSLEIQRELGWDKETQGELNIHNPIGTGTPAQNPSELAVSLASELIAFRNNQ